MTSFKFFKERETVSVNLNGLKVTIPHDWKIVKLS
jgi:hypothetical protein